MAANSEHPEFEPHPLLRGANLMTAAGAVAHRGLRALDRRAEQVEVEVDETTRVAVRIDRPTGGTRRAALLLAHGLVGSSSSPYMIGTAIKACVEGFLVARVTSRNCDDTEALTSAAYHGGLTDDFAAVVRHLLADDQVDRVHLAGFSIGGNGILRLAAEWSQAQEAGIASVGVVSPCVDFAAAADALNEGPFRRLVQRRFMVGLRRIVRRRHALAPGTVSIEGLEQVGTIREFDDRYTAPLSGFRDVDDYYARAGAMQVVPTIRIPTLIVAARDDPLVPFGTIDRVEVRENVQVRLLAPAHGGHVGFIGRRPARAPAWLDRDRRWAENRLVQHAVAQEGLEASPLEPTPVAG